MMTKSNQPTGVVKKKKRNNKDTTHTPLILEREQKLQNVNKPGND